MQVTVQYTTQLRTALGRTSERVELPESATLKTLIESLAHAHPEAFQQFVLDADGKLLPNIIVTVGDQQVIAIDDHALGDGETVTLLSAISGG